MPLRRHLRYAVALRPGDRPPRTLRGSPGLGGAGRPRSEPRALPRGSHGGGGGALPGAAPHPERAAPTARRGAGRAAPGLARPDRRPLVAAGPHQRPLLAPWAEGARAGHADHPRPPGSLHARGTGQAGRRDPGAVPHGAGERGGLRRPRHRRAGRRRRRRACAGAGGGRARGGRPAPLPGGRPGIPDPLAHGRPDRGGARAAARGGSRLRALVVLDASRPASEETLDRAVRAAASLCLHLARAGGCALLLPGDRRPLEVGVDLGAWPQAHARLALVEEGGPPLLAAGRRAGAVVWVSGAALRSAPRALERLPAAVRYLVTPEPLPGRRPLFSVAGCSGHALERARRPGGARAA